MTGKFTPLQQWLNLDCVEVLPPLTGSPDAHRYRGDRFDRVRHVLGSDTLEVRRCSLRNDWRSKRLGLARFHPCS